MKIAVTGANGYIGRAVVARLLSHKHQVVALVRQKSTHLPDAAKQIIMCDLSHPDLVKKSESVFQQLQDFDAIIHAAALAHSHNNQPDHLTLVHQVNVEATLNLARLAQHANIRRFVFLSSIGVNGNRSITPFIETNQPNPHNHYARCKYEAEQGLLQLAKQSSIEVVIVRPPLVYGYDAPGNFAKLRRLIQSGVPLPLGNVQNQRSLLALDNLTDFLMLCADYTHSPKAKNQVFLVADSVSMSTTELVQKIAISMRKRARFIPMASSVLQFMIRVMGKQENYVSLFESLQVNTNKAKDLLGWQPSVGIDQQLNQDKITSNEKSI